MRVSLTMIANLSLFALHAPQQPNAVQALTEMVQRLMERTREADRQHLASRALAVGLWPGAPLACIQGAESLRALSRTPFAESATPAPFIGDTRPLPIFRPRSPRVAVHIAINR